MLPKFVPTGKPYYQPLPGNIHFHLSLNSQTHQRADFLSFFLMVSMFCVDVFIVPAKALCGSFPYDVPVNSEPEKLCEKFSLSATVQTQHTYLR